MAQDSPSRLEVEDPHLVFVTHGARTSSAHWRASGARHSYPWTSGRVCFLNAGYELSSVTVPTCRKVVVQFDTWTTTQLLGDEGYSVANRLRDHFVTTDPQIGRIIRAIYSEVADDCPSGRLYGESLSLALLSYLLATYSRNNPEAPAGRVSPSERRFRRVLDHIRDNLDQDLSLKCLSDMVGMTPPHLVATFKARFGTSPHQYITQERIRKGRKLLAGRRHSVAEIAFLLGFSSQSHFTAIFRKMMGVTPAKYRRCI